VKVLRQLGTGLLSLALMGAWVTMMVVVFSLIARVLK